MGQTRTGTDEAHEVALEWQHRFSQKPQESDTMVEIANNPGSQEVAACVGKKIAY
jgi:hypothetical protein